MLKRQWLIMMILSALALPNQMGAQTMWDRRDPNSAYIFHDFRARRVGDILTIAIEETTGSEAQEKRQMEKNTNNGITLGGTGSSSALGQVLRSFAYELDLNSASKRKFDGNNNSSIDRKFTDRISVVVVGVLPNGNIVVEKRIDFDN